MKKNQPQKPPLKNPAQADPMIYASVMTQWLSFNPFQAIAGNLVRDFKILGSIHKKRQLCQMKIDLINERIAKLEEQVNRENAQPYGQRLNKLR